MKHKKRLLFVFLLFILLLLAIALRIVFLPFISRDLTQYVLPWYAYIVSHGIWASFNSEFSNYTPPYIYILSIATLTKGMISATASIKAISFVFDIVNACLVGYVVFIFTQNKNNALLAGTLFLLLPTIILNSAVWGQANSIYTCFILTSFILLIKNYQVWALFAFGVAFAFKPQAIFFIPFLLLLTFKKRITWYFLILIPFTYLLLMIPALLSGRTLYSVTLVYLKHADAYNYLSMLAPNPYIFIPNDLYQPVVFIGVATAAIILIGWAIWYSVKITNLNIENMLICAAVSVSLTPFLLPKMHERYFYLMDVFAFLLAFCIPGLWLPAVLAQAISVLTYTIFLFNPDILTSLSRNVFSMAIAVSMNIILVGYLLWIQYRIVASRRSVVSQVD